MEGRGENGRSFLFKNKNWTLKKKRQGSLGGRGGITSIFRPSTSVPWSFSLALSASALVSNVTKPKPWRQTNRGGRKAQIRQKHKSIHGSISCQQIEKEKISSDLYLGPPLVENDLHVEDFSKLLKEQKEKKKMAERARKTCHASCHRVSALSNHHHLAPSQLRKSFPPTISPTAPQFSGCVCTNAWRGAAKCVQLS